VDYRATGFGNGIGIFNLLIVKILVIRANASHNSFSQSLFRNVMCTLKRLTS